MQFLTNLISKVGLFVFFILLEIAAVYFMATKSDFHKNAIGVRTMAINASISEKTSHVLNFFNLPEINKSLTEENARLKNELSSYKIIENELDSVKIRVDSMYQQKYSYVAAEVVDYNLRRKDNYFLINKGKQDGVTENMAVLSPHGVVGAVLNASDGYASVLSVLHSKTNIKARVKGNDRFGIIKWPGENHKELSLTEMPKYLNIQVGDTVITAGASAIYPEGVLIGQITSLEPNDTTGDFEIIVEMFDDLSKIRNVYVVKNLDLLDIEQAKSKEDVITN